MQRSRCTALAGALALTASLLFAAAPASGQGFGGGRRGGMMGRMAMQPELMTRDLAVLASDLELDHDQRAVVEQLVRDYQQRFEEESEAFREALEALGPPREEREARRQEMRAHLQQMRAAMEEYQKQEAEGEPDPARLEELRVELEVVRAQMREMRPPMPDDEELAAMQEKMDDLTSKWKATREEIYETATGGIEAVLNEPQLQRWQEVELKLRRSRLMPQGRLAGESVDLVTLVDRLELDDARGEALQPLLDQYAIELDRALAARQERLEQGPRRMMTAMRDRDPEAAKFAAAQDAEARLAVRDLNERYLALLAAELDEQQAAALQEGWRDRAFPRIFRTTSMERAFDTVLAIEGLADETRGTVTALQQQFEQELSTTNERIMQTVRREEPQEDVQRVERWIGRMSDGERRLEERRFGEGREGRGDRPEDPIRTAFDQRDELEQRYRQSLEALLTPEQIALLPEQRERDGRRGRDGDRRGGDRRGSGDDGGRARMIERFDTNGDGELSEEERAEMRRAMEERWGRDM